MTKGYASVSKGCGVGARVTPLRPALTQDSFQVQETSLGGAGIHMRTFGECTKGLRLLVGFAKAASLGSMTA